MSRSHGVGRCNYLLAYCRLGGRATWSALASLPAEVCASVDSARAVPDASVAGVSAAENSGLAIPVHGAASTSGDVRPSEALAVTPRRRLRWKRSLDASGGGPVPDGMPVVRTPVDPAGTRDQSVRGLQRKLTAQSSLDSEACVRLATSVERAAKRRALAAEVSAAEDFFCVSGGTDQCSSGLVACVGERRFSASAP